MQNVVKLLDKDIIYVQKVGSQTERSMLDLFAQINELVDSLRTRNKPVLILSDSTKEGVMDDGAREIATRIGTNLDYDKSATYGSTPFIFEMRKRMIAESGLGHKVADFKTRQGALSWLLESTE